MLEKLVHTGRQIPKHQVCVTFEFPDDLSLTTLDEKHRIGWRNDDLKISRQSGDAWLESSQTAILLVPSVVFDVDHDFAGCIPGCHEILRRQGLMTSIECLDPHETLSPGQSAGIDRLYATYPELNDDAFVAANLERWRN